MASSDIELSPEERHLISEAIRTGDLDLFTNFYMQLPNSGSMWMSDDVLASMFVYCLALRIDGGLWDRLADSLSTMDRPCDDLDAGRAILRSTCRAASPSGTESHTRPADRA